MTRHIPLDGALNFRDFGNYPCHQGGNILAGRFFRSDKLNQLTDNDHQVLSLLGIQFIFDLRRPDETAFAPTHWMANSDIKIHEFSLIRPEHSASALLSRAAEFMPSGNPGKAMMQRLYRALVMDDNSRHYLGQIFTHLLNQPESIVLVHCSGGKDRTGVTCALIQWVLGCDQEVIYHDYMLSKSLYCDNVDSVAKFQQMAKINADIELNPEWIDAIMAVYPDYLDAMFESLLDNYQDAEDFLIRGLGLSAGSQARLQALYVG